MANTVTISKTQYEQLVRRVVRLEKIVKSWAKGALDTEPAYGSDEWWEWSNKKGLEEIRKGKGTVIRNKKELDLFFNNLIKE